MVVLDWFSGCPTAPLAFNWESGVYGESPMPDAGAYTDMDHQKVIQAVYDRTNAALKVVSAGAASGSTGTGLEAEQVLRHVFDSARSALRVVAVSGGSGAGSGAKDWRQVIRNVYDPDRQALRVIVEPAAITLATKLDYSQIIERLYDYANVALRVNTATTASSNLGTPLDWQQVWRPCLDAVHGWLKVVS